MVDILWNIASFVVALGLLVAVHEWGHYYVARLCGVKVLRFSIGFGKPIYKRITSSGMEFVIAAIPLGGYVKMLDGRVDDLSKEDEAVAFNFQPVWQRFAIVAAGPGINFIFAIFVSALVFMIGQNTFKPYIGKVDRGSYIDTAGVQEGDKFVAIGEHSTTTWKAVNIELMSYIGKDEIPLTVEKSNGNLREYLMRVPNWNYDPESGSIFESLGFEIYRPEVFPIISSFVENSPAELAGLKENDEILKLNGTLIQEWRQIPDIVEVNANKAMLVEVLRDGEIVTIELILGERNTPDGIVGSLGIYPTLAELPESHYFNYQSGPFEALVNGTKETWRLMTFTVQMLSKFITGDLAVKNLSGPISIAQGAGMSASYGIIAFLGFLALISVNLGIINLLPLPMLDGGHLMYFTAEWITGKPVSEAAQEIGFRIGGALLLMLMVTAIFNDIARLT
ncbi:sigma E protease regulator RseP [Glaciecola sp. MH2013]|uniref:sigma E protease regulator RseP n=1 Tax=Glaciecola sp. MH2013 TaxID=2785524 RepID=UPI00189D13A4|nr:sigma E protease regulator RseP [Glaciecola sp. MH2013]MBF7072276.1 sigma E protease regulator RseP [Glaciecola sp. MH2013]